MDNIRLGDIIDDYCIKCRRLTNHAIVSIVNEQVAKVRCRSCYHDHDYLKEQIPPSKKDLKKLELLGLEKANGADDPDAELVAEDAVDEAEVEVEETAEDAVETPAAPKKGRAAKKR